MTEDQVLDGVKPDLTIDEIMNLDPDKLSPEQRHIVITKMIEARRTYQTESVAANARGGRVKKAGKVSPEAIKALLDDIEIDL